MKYIYDPNKDKALIIQIDKFKYRTSFRKEFIAKTIHCSKYGDEAIKTLAEIDERFKNVSDKFKNSVIGVSCSMEIGCANLKNESYTELIYPKYTDILLGICYYQALERTPLTNPNDLSIYEEARDYKLNHCQKSRKAITPEEKEFVSAFQEVSDKNYLKRIQAEQDKEDQEFDKLLDQFREKLLSKNKKSA